MARKIKRDTIIAAATAAAVSSAFPLDPHPDVTIVIKAVGGTVAFKWQPFVTTEDYNEQTGDSTVDFTIPNDNAGNSYFGVNVGDTAGELSTVLPDAAIEITAAGTYVYKLNWNLATALAIKLTDPDIGTNGGVFAGTVAVEVLGSNIDQY